MLKNCAVHRFLFALKEKIVQADWEKIDKFIMFTKLNEENFKFVHEFYAVSERNGGWKKNRMMNKLYFDFRLL